MTDVWPLVILRDIHAPTMVWQAPTSPYRKLCHWPWLQMVVGAWMVLDLCGLGYQHWTSICEHGQRSTYRKYAPLNNLAPFACLKFGLFGLFFQPEQCFSLTTIQPEQYFSASFSQSSDQRTGPLPQPDNHTAEPVAEVSSEQHKDANFTLYIHWCLMQSLIPSCTSSSHYWMINSHCSWLHKKRRTTHPG